MGRISNFTEFFKNPREIFIQNMSGKQIIMGFDLGSGRSESFLLPVSRDPINLTQHIPWDAIKNSMDIRRLMNKSPELIRLLEHSEAMDVYKARATQYKILKPDGTPDIEKAQQLAEDRASDVRANRPARDLPAPAPAMPVKTSEADETVAEPDVIRPQLLNVINQVSNPDLSDKDVMPAAKLLEALESMPDLKMEELEYIRAKGRYKTVKNWAKDQMDTAMKKLPDLPE